MLLPLLWERGSAGTARAPAGIWITCLVLNAGVSLAV